MRGHTYPVRGSGARTGPRAGLVVQTHRTSQVGGTQGICQREPKATRVVSLRSENERALVLAVTQVRGPRNRAITGEFPLCLVCPPPEKFFWSNLGTFLGCRPQGRSVVGPVQRAPGTQSLGLSLGGDGHATEGHVHAALNFAGQLVRLAGGYTGQYLVMDRQAQVGE